MGIGLQPFWADLEYGFRYKPLITSHDATASRRSRIHGPTAMALENGECRSICSSVIALPCVLALRTRESACWRHG